ncbi:hypothetical protein L916_21736 [Phytophthora nicotianae]|uniref:Uncharacterized protein n=1 Tax=Phytophthora nicotianae TaxID=4792 RepID=W2HSY0_PHYNI|nr:hypothetical protein L916_21736 [Phytophthora nicotianae]
MDPNTLALAIQGLRATEVDLSTLGLDQDTFLALQRFQQEADDQEDPFALVEALAKTAQQVQSSASKRSRHGSDDGSLDDSSEEKTPVPSGRGSRAGSAAATGEGSAAAASSPTPSRRGLHKPKAWKNKLKSKRQKAAPRSQASARFHSSQISRCSTPRPPARSPSVAHAKSSVSRPRSRSHSVSSHPAISKSPASSTSVPATPPKAEPSKDDQPPAVMNLTQDGSDEGMDEGSTAVPTVPEDPEVTHPASPTPQASFKYNNVASPPSYFFGSDDDEDAPSSSKASCEPAGLTSPYRSSSEEDTPSPPLRSDRPPISKQPSVPPPRSPDSSDSDEGGSSNGSHDGNGDGGDDSRDDEPSFDFPSGELVMKTSRRRLTFLEHPLLSRVLLPAFRGLLPRELHEASSSRGFRVP